MEKLMLFAGTTEGRELAQYLEENCIYAHVFVATAYGEELLQSGEFIQVEVGKLDSSDMKKKFEAERPQMVIDATHPFAQVVSDNIKMACDAVGIEYLRLLRSFEERSYEHCVYVESIQKAVEHLNKVSGRVLVTTGSKDLKALTAVNDFQQRLVIRILPDADNLKVCKELGLSPQNIICMQGPFSAQLNEAVLIETGAKFLLTKESGKAGGFYEKLDACNKTGTKAIIVGKPREFGLSFVEVKKIIDERLKRCLPKKIYVIGGGMGKADMLTMRAIEAIKTSGLLISTERILKELGEFRKETAVAYKANDIITLIENSTADKIAVVFSGDIGFFSGAKLLRKNLEKYDVEWMSGISSAVYFMNKIGKSYENTITTSVHGRDENFIGLVRENESVLLLLGGNNTVQTVCKSLGIYGMSNVCVTIGEHLSYPNEKISIGLPKEFSGQDFHHLSVMLIENPMARKHCFGMDDKVFVRGEVPMTKNEVRTISLAKMKLTKNAVVYDIGAGTGSISIECACIATGGRVFAIEENSAAVNLIKENMKKHGASNIEVVEGNAPLAMEGLPDPTHVFVGGSNGNLKGIIESVITKNPRARVVMNAVTLETLGIAMEFLKSFKIEDSEIIQLGVSRGRLLGHHHLMMAQNPIFIISFGGEEVAYE